MNLANADQGLDGAAYAVTPALWLTRIETNGNGGLQEIPIRRLTAAEERRVRASIAARESEPTPDARAEPIPDLPARIMATIERDGAATRPGIEAETGATAAQVYKALGNLRDAGRIRLEGHGPSARYVPADD